MAQAPRGKKDGTAAKAAPAKGRGAKPSPKKAAPKKPVAEGPHGPWASFTLAAILIVLAARVVVLALEWVPVHFDEAQYWAYGQELAWGYYSKPPMIAWVIRAMTSIGGDTLFWLRLASPLCHAGIAWLIFLIGRRLWTSEVGFWAAAGYTAAPGVVLSSMIMSTDPLLMLCWAAAFYALVRADEAEGRLASRSWWAVTGALIGAGMLAKYTMVAFAIGALGYVGLSLRGRDWASLANLVIAALAVMLPNLLWNADHGFVTVGHVIGDADPGKGYFHPVELAAFAGAQFAVIGPVFMVAILLAVRNRGEWRDDSAMRLAIWMTLPLLIAMTALSLATRAQANWAAPAYIGGALIAARWLVGAGGWPALRAQLWTGVVAAFVLWGGAWAYHGQAGMLTQRLDPFKQMRTGEPFCEVALGIMGDEGAQALLSDNRRRLSECMFLGGLGWDEVAIWNPSGLPHNHHQLVSSLQPGDEREMLLVVHRDASKFASRFREAHEVESGWIGTHQDRAVPYQFWIVQGFKGY